MTTYNTDLNKLNKTLDEVFTNLDTYLNTTSTTLEYSFVKGYINKVLDRTKFKNQDNTNYIILYKMFNNIDYFGIYNQQIDANILFKAINPNN